VTDAMLTTLAGAAYLLGLGVVSLVAARLGLGARLTTERP